MATKRKKKILIIILLIFLAAVILGAIFSKVIIKKLVTQTIKEKTGIEVDGNLDKTKLVYKDPKSGQILNIGENKVPDNFPKDFPTYPNSTITSSLTGNGFWLTLTTSDSEESVISFYESNLKLNGWKIEKPQKENWTVSKNTLSGFLTITKTNNLTSVLIVLGENNN
jgi:hypothetical protein